MIELKELSELENSKNRKMNRVNKTNKSGLKAGPRWKPGPGSQPLDTTSALYRRLAIVAVLFLGFGLIIFLNADSLSQRVNQSVTKVRMENQWQRVSDVEVREMLSEFMGTGFFDFDVLGVKQTLELHPWIRKADVKKIWPNSLGLHLTEEVAIARWSNGSLLNQYGEIFKPSVTSHLQQLPLLQGPADSQILVMEQYRAVNQLFFSAGLRVTSLTLSDRGTWSLSLNDELEIIAGREEVMSRLGRFLAFYNAQESVDIENMLAVDLRYSNGLAVHRLPDEVSELAAR